jgi:tetratricopeptide (TPR) repeat protein
MLNNQGVGAFWRGDYEAALKAYEDSLEIARSIGLRDREGIFLSNLAGAQVGVGMFAEAETSLRQAIAIVGGQVVHYLPHTYIFLAEALRGQGRLAEAVESAQKACQIAKDAEQLETFSTALRTMGDCLAAMGNDVDRIRACYRESERLAAEIHADADRARTLRAWAKFEHAQTNLTEAQSMLGQAKSIFERLGMDREAQKCLFDDTKSDAA